MNLPSQNSPWCHSTLLIPFWPPQITGKPRWVSLLLAVGVCRCLLPGHPWFLSTMNSCCLSTSEHMSLVLIPARLWEWPLSLFSPHEGCSPKQLWHFPLTFHLYLICYLLSLSDSFLHCCPPCCSPVFYFCLLFPFFLPLERNALHLSTFRHKPLDFIQCSELHRFSCAPSLLLPFASNLPQSFSRTKLIWFSFSSGSQPLISPMGRKDGQAMNLSENQTNFLLILVFFQEVFALWSPREVTNRMRSRN